MMLLAADQSGGVISVSGIDDLVLGGKAGVAKEG